MATWQSGTRPARAVLHLNVADFAVAVERVLDRSLRRQAVIVAPQGAARAQVYDMSEEAFQQGVRKHMALGRAQRLCRRARVVDPHPHHYQRAMRALGGYARPYSPLLEAEEASGHIFLDLSGTGRLWGPPQDVAWRLRREARDLLGLEPIWALAPNKLVAKVASRVVKPLGECIVEPGQEEAFLRPLPLHLLPGIERADLLCLRELNLWQVSQAARWSPAQLGVVFGRRGGDLYRILRGRDDSPVLPARQRPRISLECQLTPDSNQAPQVEAALLGLVERAGARLRRAGRVARRVAVALLYSDGARMVRQRGHRPGTANDFALFALARAALQLAWQRRVRLRRLRLICQDLVYPPAQMELFPAQAPGERDNDRLLAAMDRIRERHGAGMIRLGRSLAA